MLGKVSQVQGKGIKVGGKIYSSKRVVRCDWSKSQSGKMIIANVY